MKLKIFNILKDSTLKIVQKNDFELFSLYSKLYFTFFDQIDFEYKNIIFFRKKHDCIDYYAIMDEMIKKEKNVYLLELGINNYFVSKIDKITNFISIKDGIYSYPKAKSFNWKDVDIIVYPVQIVNNNYCYIYNAIEYSLLKKFKGIKIGIGFKESLIDKNIKVESNNFMKFDKIILV